LLERAKDLVRSLLGVSPDALLMLAGLGCFLATCLLARRSLAWPWALVPGLCLAVALEAVEIWSHYGARGLLESGARDLAAILARHLRDVLIMNAGALLVLVVASVLSRAAGE